MMTAAGSRRPSSRRSSDAYRGGSSLAPFRRRGFLLVWTAGLVSMAGDWMLKISLPILVFEQTGSVTATSAVVIANGIPTLLFGGVAGVFVDRWDRRRVMVLASLAQALAVIPLVAVDGAGTVWIVYAVTFVVASLGQFFQPAEGALLPALVEPDELVAANSLNAVNNNLARLAGPAVGGVVAAVAGLAAVAIVDAATFLVAVVLLALVPGRYRAAGRDHPGDGSSRLVRSGVRQAAASVWRELVDGMALIRQSRVLRVLIATFTLTSVGEGLMGALFAVYVKEGLNGGVAEVGWLMSAQAVGGIVGGLCGGWFGRRFSPVRLISVGSVVFGCLDLMLFVYPLAWTVFWPAVVLIVMVGIPAVIYGSSVMALIQASIPDEFRGRVFAAMGTSMGMAAMIGAGLGGAFGDQLGAMVMLIVQGAGYVVAGVVVGILLGRRADNRTGTGTDIGTDIGAGADIGTARDVVPATADGGPLTDGAPIAASGTRRPAV
jgi:predicted MFS family arabinose efflux permease